MTIPKSKFKKIELAFIGNTTIRSELFFRVKTGSKVGVGKVLPTLGRFGQVNLLTIKINSRFNLSVGFTVQVNASPSTPIDCVIISSFVNEPQHSYLFVSLENRFKFIFLGFLIYSHFFTRITFFIVILFLVKKSLLFMKLSQVHAYR